MPPSKNWFSQKPHPQFSAQRIRLPFLQTHFETRTHFSSAGPDDPRVLDAFLSNLNNRNVKSDISTTSDSHSDSPSSHNHPIEATPLLNLSKDNLSQSVSSNRAESDVHQSTLSTEIRSSVTSEMTGSENQPKTPSKGLGSSKWSLDSTEPSELALPLSPAAKAFSPSTLATLEPVTPLKSIGNETMRSDPKIPQSPHLPISSANPPQDIPPVQIQQVKVARGNRKERFKTISTPENSIFSDFSPARARQEKSDSLERKIQENKDAKEKLREQSITSTPIKGAQISQNVYSTLLKAELKATTPELNYSSKEPTKPVPSSRAASGQAERQVYTVNELRELSLDPKCTTPKPVNQLKPAQVLHTKSDAALANLFGKLSVMSPERTSQAATEAIKTNFQATQYSQPPQAAMSSKDTTEALLSVPNIKITAPELSGDSEESIGSKNETKAIKSPGSDSEPVATAGNWSRFAHQEQAKSATSIPGDAKASLDEQLFFKSYPKPTKREGPAPEERKVVLKPLPVSFTPKLLTSIIYGGPLELVQYEKGSPTAYITFLHGRDARKFYDESENGIECPEDPLRAIWVELADDKLPHSPMVKQSIELGWTRSVRMIGISKDVPGQLIAELAQGDKKERKVISISINKLPSSGAYAAEIHFCSIKDAYMFTSSIRKNEEWEHLNIQYIPDPCAVATGPNKTD